MTRDYSILSLAKGSIGENIGALLQSHGRDGVDRLIANHALGQVDDRLMGHDPTLDELISNARDRAARDNRRNGFECDRLARAFQGSGIKPILLKGAAYQMTGSRAGLGRRSSDVDILIPHHHLADAEAILRAHGYVDHGGTLNPYDQAYYRRYMHELPPLVHSVRRTVLDVHHALSPRTARIREKTDLIIDQAVDLGTTGLQTLCPMDRFCHAALHSLYDGSFENPVRHLLDLCFLYEDLSQTDKKSLIARAEMIGLMKPVRLALWLLSTYRQDLGPVSLEALDMPGSATLRGALLRSIEAGQASGLTALFLYARGHLLRMPFWQLSAHLIKKARRRLIPESAGPEADRQKIEDHLR